jgi:hypothetical protein
MSNYSEDFIDSPIASIEDDKQSLVDTIEKNKLSDSFNNTNSKLSSLDNHQDQIEKNMNALKEEIKALEIEQMQNLETFDSGETLEIADDSSEDDMEYIKKIQSAIKKAQPKPRSYSRPQNLKPKELPVLAKENFKSNNLSFNSKLQTKKNLKKEKAFFYVKPKQVISAMPDINHKKKKINHFPRTFKLDKTDTYDKASYGNSPDWKKSVLESLVNSGVTQFNSENNPNVLIEEEILNLGGKYSIKALKKTFKKLCAELCIDNKFNVTTARVDLQRLLMARKNIVSLLKTIHEREDILIAILTLGKEAGTELVNMHSKLLKLSKSIMQSIQKCKDSILGINCFVYFGEDYTKKMQDDQIRISRIVGNIN